MLRDLLGRRRLPLGADAGSPPTGKPPELCVELPLAYYNSQKETLRKRLFGLAVHAGLDGGPERRVSFSRVLVVPQGPGSPSPNQGASPTASWGGGRGVVHHGLPAP